MKFSYSQLIVLLSVISLSFVASEETKSQRAESSDEKWFGLGYNSLRWNYWNGLAGWGGIGSLYPWLGAYSGAYGIGLCSGNYLNSWFKSAQGEKQRRSFEFNSGAQLQTRGEPDLLETVTCKNTKGESQQFLTSSCLKAAEQLVEKQTSSATCGSCTLQLHGPSGDLSAKSIPASELTTAASNILKACSKAENKILSTSELQRRGNEAENSSSDNNAKDSKNSFAVVLLKGNGPDC
ncbi:hypothetical protein BY996DRAFT_6425449 [Phakopsora pachyrhizi]|uniref:Expressed protein n=1 Tax=Phakopsora pachyrhizi TaxID=170000 RepID=A0AAV0ARK7_PHAPC|nr:hypothetical protein BY996DRAFT_6425449 [Phakopsora pachyrhizi]CAH7671858.1 expressed protein [Phakopsora pachyrhizi]CAH7671859.1 expressed protein [Phakopsora pachyrhizi]